MIKLIFFDFVVTFKFHAIEIRVIKKQVALKKYIKDGAIVEVTAGGHVGKVCQIREIDPTTGKLTLAPRAGRGWSKNTFKVLHSNVKKSNQ